MGLSRPYWCLSTFKSISEAVCDAALDIIMYIGSPGSSLMSRKIIRVIRKNTMTDCTNLRMIKLVIMFFYLKGILSGIRNIKRLAHPHFPGNSDAIFCLHIPAMVFKPSPE